MLSVVPQTTDLSGKPLTASDQATWRGLLCPEQARCIGTGRGWWGACLEHEAGRASNSVDSLYPPQGRGLCISSIPCAQGFLHLGCAVSLTFPGCLVAVLSYTEPDGMEPVRSSPNSSLTAASVHCGAEEPSQGLWGSRGGVRPSLMLHPSFLPGPQGCGEQLEPSRALSLDSTPH